MRWMRWIMLVFLLVAMAINFADKSVAGYAAVPIMDEFKLDYSQWGMVGSSFFWFFSIAGVLGGALSDRIGTKHMVTIMLIIWTAVQFAGMAVTGLLGLILIRILLGIGEGAYYSVGVSHLSKWFPAESRGMAISFMNFGGTLGITLSAPILVAIIHGSGWRMAFGVLGMASLVLLVIWLLLGKVKEPKEKVTPSKPVSKPQKVKWADISSSILNPTFIATCFAAFAGYWIMSYAMVWMPTYLTKVKHYTPTEMSFTMAFMGILGGLLVIVCSLSSDRLFKKNRNYRKSHVYSGGVGLIIAAFLFYSITFIDNSGWILFVSFMVYGLSNYMLVVGPQIVNSLIPQRGGLMTGIMMGFATLSGIVGSYVIGKIVNSAGSDITAGFNQSILLSAILLAAFGLLFLFTAKPEKHKQTSVDLHQYSVEAIKSS